MLWNRRLTVLVLGLIGASGPAAALTIAEAGRPAPMAAAAAEWCTHAGCVQRVQMMDRLMPRINEMPPDQRALLVRLLSDEFRPVVSSAERNLFDEVLRRDQRLSGEAVAQLRALLREKEGLREQQLAAAREAALQAERQKRAVAEAEKAAAAAERQRQELAARQAAERERERQADLAAAAQRERQRQAARSEAERERDQQADLAAAAERERQRQAALREAERERERAELAAAAEERERQRQAALREAERERQRQEEVAQALAEAKQLAEEAARNAAQLVFHDEFPPLQPL